MASKVTQLRRWRLLELEQGFTLVEALVAIVVIGIVVGLIAPPILLTVATRLQNQRVEQSIQVAQGEIDRVRLVVERGEEYTAASLPPVSTATDVKSTSAPGSINENPTTRTATQGFSVDLDKKIPLTPEFVVQTFRNQGQPTTGTAIAFEMGVRVYRYAPFASGTTSTLVTQPLKLGFTSGQNLQRPLTVYYIPIVRGDLKDSLCQYRKSLDSSASCP